MNRDCFKSLGVIASAFLVPTIAAEAQVETNGLNHIRFVPWAGFGVKARFQSPPSLSLNSGQTTPDGKLYNYSDGYVLTDISGNAGGQTWNWGYNSSGQVSGNTILLHQTMVSGGINSSSSSDLSNPGWGGELIYDRELGTRQTLHFGIEGALNYMNLSLSAGGSGSGDLIQKTDAYAFTPGTTPPTAPYQGTFNGPGFLIGSVPGSSSSTILPGAAAISTSQKLDANVWGIRLGPYLEFPADERVNLSLSAGLSAALLNTSVSWSETASVSGATLSAAGGGHNWGLLYGAYVATNLSWALSNHWEVESGLEFQYLGVYRHSFDGDNVELNFSKSIFVTLGVSYSF